MPYPIASTFASRFRRPAPDPEASDLERPGGVLRFWSLLPVALAFGLFGAVVWLAYKDTSLAPPVGEPPLIKAAADPFKLPPDETEETTLGSEEGAVGRLWSDAEQVDPPERLLPRPETPLSPSSIEERATAEATPGQPASEVGAADGSGAGESGAGLAGLPAEAAQPASEESLREAEAALDRLLAEVTAMSEDPDAAAPPAEAAPAEAAPPEPAPAEQPARLEPPVPPEQAAPAPTASTAAAPAAPVAAPAPAEPAPADPAAAPAPPARALAPLPEVRPAGAIAAAPPASTPEPPGRSTEIAAATPAQRAIPRPPIAPDGDYRIQLAAVRGEADARRAWQMFMGDLGPVLADVEPIFERADTANGVFYRVQVGPFASEEAAEGLCEQLKQRNASCFVIRR